MFYNSGYKLADFRPRTGIYLPLSLSVIAMEVSCKHTYTNRYHVVDISDDNSGQKWLTWVFIFIKNFGIFRVNVTALIV